MLGVFGYKKNRGGIYTTIDVDPSTLLSGLSASWSFNNTPDDNLNANNGTATNVTYSTGQFDEAAVFSGIAYINVNDSNIFNFSNNNFAYSIWVKRTISGTREIFTGQSNVAGSDGSISFIVEFKANDKIAVSINLAGVITVFNSVSAIADTSWHNIIIQRNATKLEIFIDGNLDANLTGMGTTSINNPTSKWGFGAGGEISVLRLVGSIDEANLWNGRILTSAEIIELQTKAYPF